MLLSSPRQTLAAEMMEGQGPVPVRNYQPIQGLSLQMPGESAIPVSRGEFMIRGDFAETSTIIRDSNTGVNAVLKLNQLRSALDIRYGAMENTEVGIEVISRYNHSGALDGLITATERLFDRSAPIREQLKHQGFTYVLARNGQPLLQGTNGAFGLSDTVVHTKTLLFVESTYLPAIALRTAIKVPIGDKSRAFGTGVADLGVGLVLQKTVWNRVVFYLNVNQMLPTGHYLDLALRAYWTAMSGVEFMITPKFSVVGQFDYYQSPFGRTGSNGLDNGVTEAVLAFGCRMSQDFLLQVYGVENLDLIRDSAPDFTLGMVLTYRLPQNHRL